MSEFKPRGECSPREAHATSLAAELALTSLCSAVKHGELDPYLAAAATLIALANFCDMCGIDRAQYYDASRDTFLRSPKLPSIKRKA